MASKGKEGGLESDIAIWLIFRLNSGIFRIFELSKLNLNLNSSDRRASKIIFNDT